MLNYFSNAPLDRIKTACRGAKATCVSTCLTTTQCVEVHSDSRPARRRNPCAEGVVEFIETRGFSKRGYNRVSHENHFASDPQGSDPSSRG